MFVLELIDRCANPRNNRVCPRNSARVSRHVLWNRRVVFILLEKLIHCFKLFQVLLKHILILIAELFLNLGSCLNVLEFGEEFEGAIRTSKFFFESG